MVKSQPLEIGTENFLRQMEKTFMNGESVKMINTMLG